MSKTIFITGVNSGFGEATVRLFADKGWNVAGTVRQNKYLSMFREYKNVKLYKLDVTNFDEVGNIATQVIRDFKKVAVVVNNAGYCLMGPLEMSSMQQIKNQYETNVFGLLAVTKAFIPHFRQKTDGMFINIASSSALFNYPFASAYGSSKWAVRGISESLGIELSPFNIEVKSIYPGTHATKIFTKIEEAKHDQAIQFYKKYLNNFFSAQTAIDSVTTPDNIAKEIYKATTNRKGPLNIPSGGDAKFLLFLKRILPERVFQNLQASNILQPASSGTIGFARFLFGSNVQKVDVTVSKDFIS